MASLSFSVSPSPFLTHTLSLSLFLPPPPVLSPKGSVLYVPSKHTGWQSNEVACHSLLGMSQGLTTGGN